MDTPTTEEVRAQYAESIAFAQGHQDHAAGAAAFNRWLAAHEIEVQVDLIGRLKDLLSEIQRDEARHIRKL